MPIIKHLIVDEYGSFVSKHQGRLRVTVKQEKRLEAPLMHLETVLLASQGVSVSAKAIAACAEAGAPVYIIDGLGRPVASMYASALIGTVQTRRAQLMAYEDRRGLEAARGLSLGKIRNQASLLKYLAKYRKEKDPERYALLRDAAADVLGHEQEMLALDAERVSEVRDQMLSAEGRAAQRYWEALKLLVPEKFAWPGRRRRHAKDPFNMALNYGYGVLYGEVERALVLAGLDPYGGFLHTDRPGKPSLVFDLIEPFRPAVVDRAMLAMASKGASLAVGDDEFLTVEVRRKVAEKVHQRLDAPAPRKGQKLSLRAIIQTQARELATFVRQEAGDSFDAYQTSW
jgi:CRISPR-associated protein Cas1